MIHKEGYASILFGLTASAVLVAAARLFFRGNTFILGIAVLISLFVMTALLQFFRNPPRTIQPVDDEVLCPADGTVVVIEEVHEDEYFHDRRIQLSIFMSPLNVHVNRNPVSGSVEYFKYHPGKFLVAWHPKSSADNERTTVVYKTNLDHFVLLRQIAGAVARRIVFYVDQGKRVIQGEEMGFIKFGSRVDIILPKSAKIYVRLNQRVIGGKTILADLKTATNEEGTEEKNYLQN